MKVVVRESIPSDHAFIYATCLRSKWFNPSNDTVLKKDTFMRLTHKYLEDTLQTIPAQIACLREDPDVILGYRLKDFTYLRPQWRGQGIEEMFK